MENEEGRIVIEISKDRKVTVSAAASAGQLILAAHCLVNSIVEATGSDYESIIKTIMLVDRMEGED
jgi:hypothetical protein